MKTLLTIFSLFALLLFPAQGQGTINFGNTTANISDGTTGIFPGPLLNNTNYRVGLYYNTDTNTVSANPFLFSGTLLSVTNMSTIPGRFLGGARTVPSVAPGSYLAVQIRVWFGNHATYQDMVAAGVYDAYGNCVGGECYPRGLSQPFLVGPLGNGITIPGSLNAMQPFSLISAPIPEPSALALAALAALGLGPWAFRARK